MLNINWKPIEQADKAKRIVAFCPSRTAPNGIKFPNEYIIICGWWTGDPNTPPGWLSSAAYPHFPSHFIYYEELHQSFKDQIADQ